jgi:translation initiation factor 1
MRLFEGTPFDIPPKCDRCGKLEAECACPPLPPPQVPPEQQTARVLVEKRKRGKIVTVIRGLVDDRYLEELLTALKSACGAGGTVKVGEIEIQGDHLARVQQWLRDRGYRVKP